MIIHRKQGYGGRNRLSRPRFHMDTSYQYEQVYFTVRLQLSNTFIGPSRDFDRGIGTASA